MLAIVIGKLHPLLVHLPIGILILAFAMECMSRFNKYEYLKKAVSFTLGIGFLSAILASFTGWIMPKEGAFDEALLGKHFWFAISLTIGLGLLYILEKRRDHTKLGKFFFPLFVLNIILLSITGHFGGSLTHGSNYLFESAAAPTVMVTNAEDLYVYQDIIQPILKKKCTSCHNPEKIKGELIMTTEEGLKKGGKEGAIFVSGNAAESTMLQRVHLPKVEKKHMPPDGKVQLSNNEIKLIEWWINQGANFENKVKETEQPEAIKTILTKYQTATQVNSSNVKEVNVNALHGLIENGVHVYPTGPDSKLYSISMAYDKALTKSKIKSLRKVQSNIQELDLSFSNVDLSMLNSLSRFTNLESLNLQATNLDDGIFDVIKDLKSLKRLNLYGTKVSDQGIETLIEMKGLQEVYLWNSEVTKEGSKALANERPTLNIQFAIDESIFGDAKLKPPVIEAEQDIFEDTLGIELLLNFKKIDIYYTLDGSDPDTTSLKYENRIIIDKVTTLKAMAYKSGWQASDIVERVFSKATYKIDQIKLFKPPHEKYAGKGGATLTDYEKGSTVFTDGKWLGYQNEHLKAVLDLGMEAEISNLAIGALEDPTSYIFYPKAIKVYGSNDNKNFRILSTMEIALTDEPHPSSIKTYLLNFTPSKIRYVKVEVLSHLVNPAWHPAPGADCWVFVDEILVN